MLVIKVAPFNPRQHRAGVFRRFGQAPRLASPRWMKSSPCFRPMNRRALPGHGRPSPIGAPPCSVSPLILD
jgi:hypothetical protein